MLIANTIILVVLIQICASDLRVVKHVFQGANNTKKA